MGNYGWNQSLQHPWKLPQFRDMRCLRILQLRGICPALTAARLQMVLCPQAPTMRLMAGFFSPWLYLGCGRNSRSQSYQSIPLPQEF